MNIKQPTLKVQRSWSDDIMSPTHQKLCTYTAQKPIKRKRESHESQQLPEEIVPIPFVHKTELAATLIKGLG
jgi:hypothetical protein